MSPVYLAHPEISVSRQVSNLLVTGKEKKKKFLRITVDLAEVSECMKTLTLLLPD